MSEIIIYPTDTVWGIGAKASDKLLDQKIGELKGTSSDKPLSLMFADDEMLLRYFNLDFLPQDIDLNHLFSLEMTLGIPLDYMKLKVPSHIYKKSTFVGVRIAQSEFLSSYLNELNEPITTTSLNNTGDPPITNKNDARSFYENKKKIYSNLKFVDSIEDELSGVSSTFIFLEKGKYSFLRMGRHAEKIRKILQI